jgi:hypothetical protein
VAASRVEAAEADSMRVDALPYEPRLLAARVWGARKGMAGERGRRPFDLVSWKGTAL